MAKGPLLIASFFLILISVVISGCSDVSEKEKSIKPEATVNDNIKSLPYLSWVPVKEKDILKKGVLTYNVDSSFKGINIYSSRPRNKAFLIDMEGNTVHTWSAPFGEADGWHHIEMNSEGDLFVIIKNKMLIKMDWESNVIWTTSLAFHHDVALSANGDILSFSRNTIDIPYSTQSIPILNDYIVIMSPDGKVRKKISMYDLVGERIPEARLENILRIFNNNKDKILNMGPDTPFDVFHANSVEIIERDMQGICKKGDLLISVRELNLIMIVDRQKEKVIWSWGENDLERQHHPTLLENGNILVFDNGRERHYTRVIELNPVTKKIGWEYKGDPPLSFYSISRGGNQKLPNGNYLITESDKGHVFEVTREGETVWEFLNPDVTVMGEENKRAAIYRMMRIELPAKLRKRLKF